MIFGDKDAWTGGTGGPGTLDVSLACCASTSAFTVVAVGFGLSCRCAGGRLRGASRSCARPRCWAVAGVLYTIPSLAAFALLVPCSGCSPGDGADPVGRLQPVHPGPRPSSSAWTASSVATQDAVHRHGLPPHSPSAPRLSSSPSPSVDLAGLRLATVSTVGLVTVTARPRLRAGSGRLIYDGFGSFFRTPVTVGTIGTSRWRSPSTSSLIVAARALTPWSGRGAQDRWSFARRRRQLVHRSARCGREPVAIPNRLFEHLQASSSSRCDRGGGGAADLLCSATSAGWNRLAINVCNVGRAVPSFAILVIGAAALGHRQVGDLDRPPWSRWSVWPCRRW